MNEQIPVHILTNHFSGIAGEARVAAELLRCGIMTAKPYWNHDENDLLTFFAKNGKLLALPIQVKSVQFIPDKNNKPKIKTPIQGLKKKYVEKNRYLVLIIYRPDIDEFAGFFGSESIKSEFDRQKSLGSIEKEFNAIASDGDLPLKVPFDINDNFWSSSRIDKSNSKFLFEKLHNLANTMSLDKDANESIIATFGWPLNSLGLGMYSTQACPAPDTVPVDENTYRNLKFNPWRID